jgi:hypothetical protein
MGLRRTIDSLKMVGQLVGLIPIAGTYCEKMLGAAAQVCEVAEARSCLTSQSHIDLRTYHAAHSVLKLMRKSTSNLVTKSQDTR